MTVRVPELHYHTILRECFAHFANLIAVRLLSRQTSIGDVNQFIDKFPHARHNDLTRFPKNRFSTSLSPLQNFDPLSSRYVTHAVRPNYLLMHFLSHLT